MSELDAEPAVAGNRIPWSKQAIDGFLKRILKEKARSFSVEYIPAENDKDVFELESRDDLIVLRGNNGVSIGSALNFYLKNYCHCLVTWNGKNLNLPGKLPRVTERIRKVSPYRYRYYLNYCTFNYSMAWWDWERWQQEIDWMTLNGINMPLALTGQEAIWQKVYDEMGLTQAQLDSFFCGPAFFAWFWMGNLDAWGGPLSHQWLKERETLQKRILDAERAMGMKPVLPAFTGHVPPCFKEKFPNAKINKTNWRLGFNDVSLLDPSDPLFEKIGKRFLEIQTEIYGTDHLYAADTFNENIPPTGDPIYLGDISRKIYSSMTSFDEKAVWVMQAWMFYYDSAFWKAPQIQALLDVIPDDRMILLDLYAESFPLWKRTEGFYGKQWIWCMLHNFGGNNSLWGRMDAIAKEPSTALNDPGSGKMVGIGIAPEAIEQNPVVYHLMLENAWTGDEIQINNWIDQYAHARYGIPDPDVIEGWHILAHTVYRGGLTRGGPGAIITGRPTLQGSTIWIHTQLDYDPAQLLKAWDFFIKAAPVLKNCDSFHYDLVDLTRQLLANYAGMLHSDMAIAYRNKDLSAFRSSSERFLILIDDLDKLLGTRIDFLLGKWIEDARASGHTPKEKDQFELNARLLVTLWGGKDSPLHDYSCRQWSGLLSGFYKPRWKLFIDHLIGELSELANGLMIEEKLKAWEWEWVHGHEKYDHQPKGNPIDESIRCYIKYRKLFHSASSIQTNNVHQVSK